MKYLNLRNLLILIGTIVVIYLLLQLKNCKPKPKPKPVIKAYWENPNFKTKIIKVNKPYAVHDSFSYQVPPQTIILWKEQEPRAEVICDKDSLIKIIDSLSRVMVLIKQNYLTQYPKASKLVYGLFTKDTLKLDLLKINGQIESQIYPVDYSRFKYQYRDNKLKADTIPYKILPLPKEKLTQALYVSGGYSIFKKVPIASADYYIRYRRFQLNVEPKITIEQNPTLELNAKLGYRVK